MANTFTTNLRLAKPEVGILDWHLYYYDAMNIIDIHLPRIFQKAPLVTAVTPAVGGSLTASQYYFYRVSAFKGALFTMSSWEDWRAQADGTNKTMNVDWGAVTGATKYRIYRYDTNDGSYMPVAGDFNLLAEITAPTVTYVDDGSIVPSGAVPSAPDWYVSEIKQAYLEGDTSEAQTQHGTPATSLENMNNLRYMIKALNGDTNWNDAPAMSLYQIANGKAGGLTYTGGTASGEDLNLRSTAHATKGQIIADSELDMTTHKIVNVVDPINPQEAATKQYVDNYVTSGGWVEYRESFIVGTPSGSYTGSTTVFALANNYVTNGKNLDVFYDGVKMRQGASYDYVETDGFTVTFNTARVAGRTITMEWGAGAAPASVINERRENFTATASQTVFNLVNEYLTGGKNLKVYVDGVLMTITDDYTETDTDTVTFVVGMSGGEKVSFVWGDPVASGNAEYLNNIAGSATPEANKYLSLNSNAKLNQSVLQNTQNLLVNGGFEYGTFGKRGYIQGIYQFICEGWRNLDVANNCNADVFRESSIIDGVNGYSLKVVVNTSGSGSVMIGQRIGGEVYNWQNLQGRQLTISLRVKTTLVSKVRCAIQDNGGITYSSFHTGDDTWQTLTATRTIGGTAPFFVWGMIDDADTATGTFYVDSGMCVFGPDQVDFTPRPEVPYSLMRNEYALNLLDNGGMNIWQRGTSFPGFANGTYLLDRWKIYFADATANGGQGTGEGAINYSADFNCATVGASPYLYAQQNLEYPDLYRNKTLALTVKLKVGATGRYRIRIADGVGTTTSADIAGGDWYTLSITHVVASNPSYIAIMIGAVEAGDAVINEHIAIENAILVTGKDPVWFVPSIPQADLARCQRYYEKGYVYMIAYGAGDSSWWYLSLTQPFNTVKQNTPTMTPTSGWLVNEDGSGVNQQASYVKSLYPRFESVTGEVYKSQTGSRPAVFGVNWSAEIT